MSPIQPQTLWRAGACYRRRGGEVRGRLRNRDWSVWWWFQDDLGGGVFAHQNSSDRHRRKSKRSALPDEVVLPVIVPHLRQNRGMSFLQDNAPAHSARGTQRMLQQNNIRVIALPPCSPDLNPIEHLWDHVDRQLRKEPQPPTLRALELALVRIWHTIPQRFVWNYVNSMRQRCLDVIRARGGHSRY